LARKVHDARTVAHKYNEKKRLGISFLFSRGGGDTCHAGRFVTNTVSLSMAAYAWIGHMLFEYHMILNGLDGGIFSLARDSEYTYFDVKRHKVQYVGIADSPALAQIL
jgi:hypothetical protein